MLKWKTGRKLKTEKKLPQKAKSQCHNIQLTEVWTVYFHIGLQSHNTAILVDASYTPVFNSTTDSLYQLYSGVPRELLRHVLDINHM